MNRVILTALFFLALYFITKPLGHTYPSVNEIRGNNLSYPELKDFFDPQDASFTKLNNWKDQEQNYI
ncbi:hypothetical protein IM40_08770 [Candidatus Paracaedimonas acanthamoebae]|nr:hypothetical protein IM40_08770 [Candidatus Paracaedimonas acanthamoebae]